jgi:hypothetical protein
MVSICARIQDILVQQYKLNYEQLLVSETMAISLSNASEGEVY